MQPISWKTTACGIVAALAAFVMFSPETFAQWPWVVSLAKFIMVGGLAGLGISSRDVDVHYTRPGSLQAAQEVQDAVDKLPPAIAAKLPVIVAPQIIAEPARPIAAAKKDLGILGGDGK
jgi:hypothetical protein